MHIHPDGVTEPVIEELAIIAGAVAAEIPGVVAHVFPRDAVQLAHRGPRPQGIKGRLLRPEHQVVNRLLARREPAVDREGPRDVGGVLPPLGRGVDDDEIAVFGAPAVHVVMQRRGIGTAPHNGRVAYAVGAVAPESFFQHRLELVLVHPRPRGPHRRDVAGHADVHRAPQAHDLVRILHSPHGVDDRRQVVGRTVRLPWSRAVNRLDRRADASVERIKRQNFRDAGEPHRHTVRTEPQPGPPFLRRCPGRQEQDRFDRIRTAGGHHEHRVLRLELREVVEGVVLPKIVVLDVVGAAADALHQRLAARGDGRDVHGPPHARQLGNDGVRADRTRRRRG